MRSDAAICCFVLVVWATWSIAVAAAEQEPARGNASTPIPAPASSGFRFKHAEQVDASVQFSVAGQVTPIIHLTHTQMPRFGVDSIEVLAMPELPRKSKSRARMQPMTLKLRLAHNTVEANAVSVVSEQGLLLERIQLFIKHHDGYIMDTQAFATYSALGTPWETDVPQYVQLDIRWRAAIQLDAGRAALIAFVIGLVSTFALGAEMVRRDRSLLKGRSARRSNNESRKARRAL
ncbi:hypothetical protein FVE85_8153 [Porphyridium purpureum]|uniref:Uncharacterized protein n=1 Tax=Porphyridium purpureum TaxID=35688 RepID=A0A5J4YMN6_PORPP|nr:hypothetical protein FVE85_8153 [Porphyridium purpureum]|eukprot:POR6772..scf295_9